MMRALSFALLLLPLAASAQVERHADVRLEIGDVAALRDAAARAGVAIDHGEWERLDSGMVLRTTLSERDVRAFRAAGVGVSVLVPDVTAAVAARARVAGCPATTYPVTGSMGCYPTYDEVLAILDAMYAEHPEIISSRTSIGTSIEGRPIWLVEISDNPGVEEGEAQALFTSLHHAREPQGLATVLHTMWDLLERYGTDPEATYLVRNRRLFFVPILNPDGYVHNETIAPTGGGMWRKNRRDNGDGSFGVDLNRNYAFQWGLNNTGSSPNPTSEVYRGTAPFSEPETAAIRDFVNGRDIRVAFNYHSHGNLLLHAWGFTPDPPPDMEEFTRQSRTMTAINNYTYGPGYTTIYPTNGNSDDWMYADTTASRPQVFAYTPEVGSGADGFWPEPERILPIAEENLRANYEAALFAGGYPVPADATYEEDEPAGNGHVDPGEVFTVSVSVLNQGQATAGNVSAFLASTSPYVEELCCALPSVESIAPGGTVEFGGFHARLTSDAPIGYLDGLAVDIYAEGDYLGRFPIRPIRIGTPVVVLSDPATDLSAWTSAGGWGLSSVAWSPPSSFTDSPTGNYPNGANATLTLASPVDLNFAEGASLHFRTRWDIEPDFDFAQVLGSTDGSNWTPIAGLHTVPGSGAGAQPAGQPGFEGVNLDWVAEEMDLSAFAGASPVHLRFRLRANSSTRHDGWWVDDVVLEGLIDGGTTAAGDPPVTAPRLVVSPNPSQDDVIVSVWLPESADAQVIVYDAVGRHVATLHEGATPAGGHTYRWDGRGAAARAAPGVYLVRLTAGGVSSNSRVTLLR